MTWHATMFTANWCQTEWLLSSTVMLGSKQTQNSYGSDCHGKPQTSWTAWRYVHAYGDVKQTLVLCLTSAGLPDLGEGAVISDV